MKTKPTLAFALLPPLALDNSADRRMFVLFVALLIMATWRCCSRNANDATPRK